MPLVTVNINVGCRCVDREPQLRLRTLGPVTEQELPGPSESGVRMIAVLRDTQKVLASLRGEPTPLAVSRVPLVSGIHGGFLDPAYNPNPAPKSLANCTTCHAKAASGTFKHVQFTVSDESFRGRESSIGVGLSDAEKEVVKGK